MAEEIDGHVWDEYKLLQEKLDRVGAFRFQVKTWCVGIFSGSLLAGAVSGVPRLAFLLVIPVVAAFWLLEEYHVHWQRALTRRTDEIERRLCGRQLPGADSPRIVETIMQANDELRRMGILGYLVRKANTVFYAVLVGLAFVLLCLANPDSPDGKTQRLEIVKPVKVQVEKP
jgi:hypothetical protein